MNNIIDLNRINLLFDIKNAVKLILRNILKETNSKTALFLVFNQKQKSFNLFEHTGLEHKNIKECNFQKKVFEENNKEFDIIFQHSDLIKHIKKKVDIEFNSVLVYSFEINLFSKIHTGKVILFNKNSEYSEEQKNISYIKIKNFIDILLNNLQNNFNHNYSNVLENFDILDPETSLYNQDFFYENLIRNLKKSEKNNSHFSLALLEIKNYNELINQHSEKNKNIFKFFCSFINENIRKIDIISILYDEILAVIFVDLNKDETLNKINELNQNIKKLNKDFAIEIGYGISTFPENGLSCERLIRNAIKTMK